jgi:hypothetical protein
MGKRIAIAERLSRERVVILAFAGQIGPHYKDYKMTNFQSLQKLSELLNQLWHVNELAGWGDHPDSIQFFVNLNDNVLSDTILADYLKVMGKADLTPDQKARFLSDMKTRVRLIVEEKFRGIKALVQRHLPDVNLQFLTVGNVLMGNIKDEIDLIERQIEDIIKHGQFEPKAVIPPEVQAVISGLPEILKSLSAGQKGSEPDSTSESPKQESLLAPNRKVKISASKPAIAMGVLVKHPDWSIRKIAEEVGCAHSTLTRNKVFKRAYDEMVGNKRDIPKGHVVRDDNGQAHVEAYDDDWNDD